MHPPDIRNDRKGLNWKFNWNCLPLACPSQSQLAHENGRISNPGQMMDGFDESTLNCERQNELSAAVIHLTTRIDAFDLIGCVRPWQRQPCNTCNCVMDSIVLAEMILGLDFKLHTNMITQFQFEAVRNMLSLSLTVARETKSHFNEMLRISTNSIFHSNALAFNKYLTNGNPDIIFENATIVKCNSMKGRT